VVEKARGTSLKRLLAVMLAVGVLTGSAAAAGSESDESRPPARTLRAGVGVQFHCIWPNYDDRQRRLVLDKMAAAGMKWVRIDVAWPRIEPEKGTRDARRIRTLERCVELAAERRLNVIGTVMGTPGWANGNAGSTTPPGDAADYGDFARWIAARFRGRVQAWEVWNEENGGTFFTGNAAQYVDLLKAAYRGFKSGDPRSLVVLGGLMWNDDDWLRELYARGAKDFFDVVATHPYSWFPEAPPELADDGDIARFTHTPAIRRVMTDYGDDEKPIWFTELGWSTHPNGPEAEANPWAAGVSEETQAAYAVRAIEYAREHWPYVGVIIWYKERSWPLDDREPSWLYRHVENYGLLREDGTERPVYLALKQLLRPDAECRRPIVCPERPRT
jgi:polysaccharide biosynthesis protein PslG